MIIGTTISFAGNPKINASKITPSSPISEPRGWRKFEIITHSDSPFIIMFDINHITIPAGAATHIALKSTKMVLSSKERTIVLQIWGLRYGGSSSVNDEGKPFRSVAERSFETKSVTTTPKTITVNNKPAETSERNGNEIPVAKNIVIIAIKVGNLPLQGTKLFVTVAIIRSLGDSIIRQPVTPQALHPNPINIDYTILLSILQVIFTDSSSIVMRSISVDMSNLRSSIPEVSSKASNLLSAAWNAS